MTDSHADTLADELKALIIETLNLEDTTPEDIARDQPLFVEGLGLDSIDALELGVALQKRYGVQFAPDEENTRQHFRSIDSLCALVTDRRTKD